MATEYSKWKVVDLKAQLKRLNLPQNGLKADLVARLEAVDSEGAVADSPSPAAEESTETPNQDKPPSESPAPSPDQSTLPGPDATTQDQEPQSAPAEAAEELPDVTEKRNQDTSVPPSTDATPPPPTEAIHDTQKRKRRSGSPVPNSEDVSARKRQKHEEDTNAYSTVGEVAPEQRIATEPGSGLDVGHGSEAEGVEESVPEGVKEKDGASNGVDDDKVMATDSLDTVVQNGQHVDMVTGATEVLPREEPATEGSKDTYASPPTEMEIDIEPSVHPATSALYIKNFMRPLRAQQVQEHLLQLASPGGTVTDDNNNNNENNNNAIVDFFLDTIRTHAFVVFNSVAAASRVRAALHDRIWPEESNRKPLWVDFIPPEHFAEWVEMESSGSGRGSTNRYEIIYEDDRSGSMTARLGEVDTTAPLPRQPPSVPVPASPIERRPSIPTGPSRPFPGVEGAPTGPRRLQERTMHPSRLERLDPDQLSTRTFPIISYRPVSDELAQRRLDAIAAAKSRDHHRDCGKEYKRYFFEHGDRLVDRGPEIFLGIRPPHREKQRRLEEQGRGPAPGNGFYGGPPGGSGFGGGGPRSGRGPRRGPPNSSGPPIYHGIPRGGDRFRPPGSSYMDPPRQGNRGRRDRW
ncbi:hypothetical protein F4778DRAFT_83263 [Xylariomycetidae sp. FL2044]|nr:hypothetical protein F4778DRAFT_83263 [Xylariomycetidae sp. FL2044]